MKGFSKAIIAGNVTRDPELRTVSSGTSVCNFSVAVNRTYRDGSGNQQESTSFIDCVAWGKAGEIINQYVRKGSPLLVSGRLDQRSWTDESTKQKRSRVEIYVEDFTFLGGGRSDMGGGQGSFSSYGATSATKGAVANTGAAVDEVVPQDLPEDPINLDELPF